MDSQENHIKSLSSTKFNLTADQIIKIFDEVQPFSGEDSYRLKSFLRNVANAEELCGESNPELKRYCLKKVITGKIIGRAQNTIMEVPEAERTWSNVVATLKSRFRPRTTVYQIFSRAKALKVINLKDLFNKFNQLKSEANEICDFDDEEHFNYNIVDKELVLTLMYKLTPMAQLQIDQTLSLFELDNVLCKTELYYSRDIIKHEFQLLMNGKQEFLPKTIRNFPLNYTQKSKQHTNTQINEYYQDRKFTDNNFSQNQLYNHNNPNNNYNNLYNNIRPNPNIQMNYQPNPTHNFNPNSTQNMTNLTNQSVRQRNFQNPFSGRSFDNQVKTEPRELALVKREQQGNFNNRYQNTNVNAINQEQNFYNNPENGFSTFNDEAMGTDPNSQGDVNFSNHPHFANYP